MFRSFSSNGEVIFANAELCSRRRGRSCKDAPGLHSKCGLDVNCRASRQLWRNSGAMDCSGFCRSSKLDSQVQKPLQGCSSPTLAPSRLTGNKKVLQGLCKADTAAVECGLAKSFAGGFISLVRGAIAQSELGFCAAKRRGDLDQFKS